MGRGSGEAEPEEACRKQDTAEGDGRHASFGDGVAVVGTGDTDVAALIDEVDEYGKEDADKEGQEGEGGDDGAPVTMLLEDNGEDFERGVEEGVDEGGIEGEAGHGWFGEEHEEGPGEVFGDDGAERESDRFVWVVVGVISRGGAETYGFAFKQDGWIRLREEDEARGPDSEGEDRQDVLCPAPAHVRIDQDGGTDDRSESGSANDSNGIPRDSGASSLLIIKIT